MKMTSDYSDKTCVVTGATSGIGRAVVLQLLAAGARVYAVGRWKPALSELDRQGAVPVRHDLRDVGLADKLPSVVDYVFALAGDVLTPLPVLGGVVDVAHRIRPGGALVLAGSIATGFGRLPRCFGRYQVEKQALASVAALVRGSYGRDGVHVALAMIGLVATPIWFTTPVPAWLGACAHALGTSPEVTATQILTHIDRDVIYAGRWARMVAVDADGEPHVNPVLRCVLTSAFRAVL